MVILIIILLLTLLLIMGKQIFGKWLNPLSIYILPWSMMLILYDLNFLRYYELTSMTWLVAGAALFSFICGILLIKILHKPSDSVKQYVFVNNVNILKYVIIIFASIGLIDVIVHWSVLFKMYGSLPGIIIHANEIYRLRIENKIPGIIPYLVGFSYSAVFFAGVYSAYRGRITMISVFPLLDVVLKEIANVGRSGILLAFLIYLLSYFFAGHVLKSAGKLQRKKISIRTQILSIVTVIVILVTGASVVRSIRGTYENFAGASKALSKTRGGLVITPSIYLYFSAHIGVLNQFLKDQNVNKGFGENTLLTAYSILSKFDLVERPSDYQDGYRVPFWTNTGTYLRELIEDFGYVGIFVFPFLLGMSAMFSWFRLSEKKDLLSLVLLTYLNSIIGISFLMMITRSGIWTISFSVVLITAVLIPMLDTIPVRNSESDY